MGSLNFLLAGIVGLILLSCTGIAASSSWQYSFGGSYKSIFEYQRLRQTGIFSGQDLPLTEQRLRINGSVSRSWFHVEFADELSLSYQRALASAIPVPNFAPASAWETRTNFFQNNTTVISQRVDRAFVQVSFDSFEVRAGKQIIDEGVGHLFSAISQVPRYAFVYIDPEYPKTEDAVAVLWKGPFTLEARFLPRVKGQREDNIHLRAKGSKAGADMALTAGRSDDKPYVGLEAAGNLGDSLLRGEIVGYEWQGKSTVQGLLGLDRVLSKTWSGQLEVFYNGFGSSSNYTLGSFTHRSAPYRGKWYLGTLLNWEVSSRLKSALASTVNIADPSVLFQLFFVFSLKENMDLVLGQYFGVGSKRDSEFGGQIPIPNAAGMPLALGLPDITYLEWKWYF